MQPEPEIEPTIKVESLQQFLELDDSKLVSLEEIKFKIKSSTTPEQLQAFFEALSKCSNLRILRLANLYLPGLTDDQLNIFFSTLLKNKKLEDLALVDDNIEKLMPNQLEEFLKTLKQLQNLRTVSLDRISLGKQFQAIFATLAELPNLEELNLTGILYRRDEHVEEFCNAIPQFRNLHDLDLSYNYLHNLTTEQFEMLGTALSKCPLQILRIEGNKLAELSPEQFEAFCRIFEKCQNLQAVYLGNNLISYFKPKVLQRLYDALSKNNILIQINGIDEKPAGWTYETQLINKKFLDKQKEYLQKIRPTVQEAIPMIHADLIDLATHYTVSEESLAKQPKRSQPALRPQTAQKQPLSGGEQALTIINDLEALLKADTQDKTKGADIVAGFRTILYNEPLNKSDRIKIDDALNRVHGKYGDNFYITQFRRFCNEIFSEPSSVQAKEPVPKVSQQESSGVRNTLSLFEELAKKERAEAEKMQSKAKKTPSTPLKDPSGKRPPAPPPSRRG